MPGNPINAYNSEYGQAGTELSAGNVIKLQSTLPFSFAEGTYNLPKQPFCGMAASGFVPYCAHFPTAVTSWGIDRVQPSAVWLSDQF